MDNKVTGTLDLNRHLIGPEPCADQAASKVNGIADDTLRGAKAISVFLFGHEMHRRKVYHLASTSRMPVFKLGSVLCARRSVLMHWITEQEKRNTRLEKPKP